MNTLLLDGDKAVFQPAFGAATVVVKPGTVQGSGPATVGGKPIVVVGDETTVSVPGCPYTTAQHTVPGVGTLQIAALASDQQAQKTGTGSKKALLVGGRFTARFTVQTPAQQPSTPNPIPDATPLYSGQGSFKSTNTKAKGT